MELPKKKRCRFCRKGFRPDPRVKDRQVACGHPDCQRARRRQTQSRWRSRNADYQKSYRVKRRGVTAAAADRGERRVGGGEVRRPSPVRVPSELESIPWDLAQAELGVVATDLLALVALLLVRLVKDQRREEKSMLMGIYSSVRGRVSKDE